MMDDTQEGFDRDFKSDFADWCEDKSNGKLTKNGKTHVECDLGIQTIGVKKRMVIPFDAYAYAHGDESVSVTNIRDWDQRGTKMTFRSSNERLHVGPDGQVRMGFDGHPSQHERSEVRDREFNR